MTSSATAARRMLAVSLLASVAALAAACSSGGAAATPTSTATAAHSPAGSGTTSASAPTTAAPTTAAPAAPAQCPTTGLRVKAGSSNGAAGTIYYNIDFTNVSSSTCILQGYPGVSLVSAGSGAGSQIGADAKRDAVTAVHPITLAAGQTAHAVLGIAEAGNFPAASCNPVTAHWLKVFPPDQFGAAYVSFTAQTCASTSEPTMHITAISSGA